MHVPIDPYIAKIAKYIIYIFSEMYILCIKYIHKIHWYKNIYFVYAKNILKIYIFNIKYTVYVEIYAYKIYIFYITYFMYI